MAGEQSSGRIELEYELDEQPPLPQAILLGLQHVAVMIVPATAVAFLVGEAVAPDNTAFLVQMVLLFSGLATIVQAYGIGPVGAKLPIVMGTSFTFVGGAISIGADFGLAAVFGALLITGIVVEGTISWQFDRVRNYFPPLVTGLIVIIIGLYLVPVAMDYSLGGVDNPDYAAVHNLGLATLVIAIAVGMNLFLKGLGRLLSIIFGIAVGYVVAFISDFFGLLDVNLIDFSAIDDAAWIEIPMPGQFGFEFEPVAIVLFGFLFLVSSMETIGDMAGVTAAEGRIPTEREFKGGILTDGLMSSLGAVFSAFPVTSFSQNVGIVNFTGVMSRWVVVIGGIFLAILGLIPKIGAVVATVPQAVFGGAVLVMAAMVATSGMRLIFLHTNMNRRNMVIIATALGLGLGVAVRPDALVELPEAAERFFREPVIMTAVVALLLNTFVPGKDSPLFGEPQGMETTGLEEPVSD